MGKCKICGKPKSNFHLDNKLVCLTCDELLFDLEIECDQEAVATKKLPAVPPNTPMLKKPLPITKK